MESVIIILPLVVSLGTCVFSSYYYNRMNNRIAILEQSLNTVSYYPLAPPASAPPAYSPGYGYHPGDPVEPRII